MGHVHLKVASIPDTVAFYRDVLGFEPHGAARRAGRVLRGGRLPPSHRREHVGERRRSAAARGNAALRHATIVLPDAAERDRVLEARRLLDEDRDGPRVRDPSGNAARSSPCG